MSPDARALVDAVALLRLAQAAYRRDAADYDPFRCGGRR
jgi:hypothetical protein